ncbi:MAG: coiled-coil domain-containing protein [Planctomycetota bacterium]|jgi:hypothetical protein
MRQSRTSGSVGGLGGNSQAYPTTWSKRLIVAGSAAYVSDTTRVGGWIPAMHQALILIARAIALAHDRWRRSVGRRLSLSGHIAVLEERDRRLEAENALLRARLVRVPARRRPRYRAHERLEILWHAARYRLPSTRP